MSQMTPREIVQELDEHIISQSDAKRAVAIHVEPRGQAGVRRASEPEGICRPALGQKIGECVERSEARIVIEIGEEEEIRIRRRDDIYDRCDALVLARDNILKQ